MFDQIKMAQQMMKNMSPDEIKDLMKQAQESKRMLEDQVKQAVEEEIKKRDLVSRDEILKIIAEKLGN